MARAAASSCRVLVYSTQHEAHILVPPIPETHNSFVVAYGIVFDVTNRLYHVLPLSHVYLAFVPFLRSSRYRRRLRL